MAVTDLTMSYAAFHQWLDSSDEDNQAERDRVKKMLPVALAGALLTAKRPILSGFTLMA